MTYEEIMSYVGGQPASTLARIATPRDNRTVREMLEEWALALQRRNLDKMIDDLGSEHFGEIELFLEKMHEAYGINA